MVTYLHGTLSEEPECCKEAGWSGGITGMVEGGALKFKNQQKVNRADTIFNARCVSPARIHF